MARYYMLEQVFYTQKFPVVSFSISKILQNIKDECNNKLDFRHWFSDYNPKKFTTKEEVISFIRKALNEKTIVQDEYCRYYIIECDIGILKRLNIIVN